MPYKPITNGAGDLPQIVHAIHRIESYYLEPVNNLLRLPIPHYRLKANFHFVIAQTLLTAIAGASTTLYEQSGKVEPRFRGVVENYYPWRDESSGGVTPDRAAKLLYDLFRCPLVHDLGINVSGTHDTLAAVMRALRSNQGGLTWAGIRSLERRQRRLNMVPTLIEGSDGTIALNVEPFYWGTRRLLERLTCDRSRMKRAAAYLAGFKHVV